MSDNEKDIDLDAIHEAWVAAEKHRMAEEYANNQDLIEAEKRDKKIQKSNKAVIEKKAYLKDSTFATKLNNINRQCAVIFHGSKVFIMRYWMGEDGQSKLRFLNSRDFLLWQANNNINIENDKGEKKQINIGKAWLEWEGRQEYEETYFDPASPTYYRRYNLWNGFAVTPDINRGNFTLFITHIYDNICQGNQERYDWVMAWLADLFQRPGRKLGTALVLRGPMGIGKGQFASHIGYLLGKHYMTITQSSQLIGKFNSHMVDKLLMFIDEGWWSDEKYGEGVLRGLITEHQVTIEMKGKDALTYANFTRFIVAANADWVVPVSAKDERRFVIFDVGDAAQRDTPYFKAINDEMKNGGYEAFIAYLLDYKYDEALPRTVINTSALTEQKIHSMPHELKWWQDCLFEEQIGEFQLRNNLDNDVPCDKFYENYLLWCQNMGVRKPWAKNALPKMLAKADVIFERKRSSPDASSKRPWYYYLQNLEDMRNYFEKHIGGKINW